MGNANSGLRKGHPNPGGFQKGYDPRRNKWTRFANGMTLTEMARTKTEECFNTIYEIAIGKVPATNKERLQASNIILERGHGKAVQILSPATPEDPKLISSSDLRQMAQAFLLEQSDDTPEATPLESEAEDGVFTEVTADD